MLSSSPKSRIHFETRNQFGHAPVSAYEVSEISGDQPLRGRTQLEFSIFSSTELNNFWTGHSNYFIIYPTGLVFIQLHRIKHHSWLCPNTVLSDQFSLQIYSFFINPDSVRLSHFLHYHSKHLTTPDTETILEPFYSRPPVIVSQAKRQIETKSQSSSSRLQCTHNSWKSGGSSIWVTVKSAADTLLSILRVRCSLSGKCRPAHVLHGGLHSSRVLACMATITSLQIDGWMPVVLHV